MPTILYHNQLFKLHFKRSESIQLEYDLQLQKLKKIGISPSEFILQKHFKVGQLITFVENEFPYDFGSEYQHWLMFAKIDGLLNLLSLAQEFILDKKQNLQHVGVMRLLEYMFDPSKIQAVWLNEEKNQSVKDLTHYHFVIKKA